ncbi:MAG: putative membrane-bound dehydrogenase-like protein [Verrucomicrobiales bacterium]|jgi:putative membrane-bound dehydrogenase-like protein
MKIRISQMAAMWLGLLPWVGKSHADLASFQHHPAIEISLFAQEPMVVDPVALAFDVDGDAYVVEMRDYPFGVGPDRKPGGTIRLLRDTDGDGQADESHLFAENLSFPTSVTMWRKGILVAAPPQVLYLEDTDGDDRADVQRVILDGFKLSVTDSNMNGLRWGWDGKMHGANGSAGGQIFSPLQPDRDPVNLSGHDFAFDPDTGAYELSTQMGGGFGLVFDRAGHSFTPHNLKHLQQRIIPRRYLLNHPTLPSFETTINISIDGDSARIHSISEAQTRVNHPEQAGRFSSSGGIGLVENGPFAEALGKSIFVCDVVGNIVHRDLLMENGPIFLGTRAPEEQDREFIASTDPNFRPVGVEHGPDGALYVIDMQREVIEHPDYIPAKVLKKMDVRAGDDRGRIYRIVPKGGLPKTPSQPNHQHGWWAATQHRLNYESGIPIIPSWDAIATKLGSAVEGKRERALIESETGTPPSAIMDKMLRMVAEDPHARVRFQAALSLGHRRHPQKMNALAKLLLRDHAFQWTRRAVWTAIPDQARELLGHLLDSQIFWYGALAENRPALLNELVELAAAESEGQDFYKKLAERPLHTWSEDDQLGLLEGLTRSWKDQPVGAAAEPCLKKWSTTLAPSRPLLRLYRLAKQPLPDNLTKAWQNAARIASDAASSPDDRNTAIALMGEVTAPAAQDALLGFLDGTIPSVIQEAALDALNSNAPGGPAPQILTRWRGLTPVIRPRLIQILLRNTNNHVALLDALDTKQITVQELNLDLEQRRTLLRFSSKTIAERASRYFGDEEYSNRKALVDEWLGKLPDTGDVQSGHAVFLTHCALCHRVGTEGQYVGPDLTGVSHRSVEDLLSHILDPNMAINPNYVTCVVETKDGALYTGLLSDETPDRVTLKLPTGVEQRVAQREIVTKQILPTSLMPEGIEETLSPKEMRSLIAYLQQSSPGVESSKR